MVSDSRLRVVDYSVPVDMEQQAIIYKRPAFEADVAGFVKPFSLSVSHCILLFLDNRSTINSSEGKQSLKKHNWIDSLSFSSPDVLKIMLKYRSFLASIA